MKLGSLLSTATSLSTARKKEVLAEAEAPASPSHTDVDRNLGGKDSS